MMNLYWLFVNRKKTASNSGFTLTELLAGIFVGLAVVGLALAETSFNRRSFLENKARADISQSLRLPLDNIGNDIKQIGEGIGSDNPNFPVISLTGNPEAPLALTIRRQLVQRILPICRQIQAGTNAPLIVRETLADDTSVSAACSIPGTLTAKDRDDWIRGIEIFRNYRLANGGSVKAYIYNGAGEIEFFDYGGETLLDTDENPVDLSSLQSLPNGSANPVTLITLSQENSNWLNTYTPGTSGVFLLEERRYQLDENGVFSLTIDNDPPLELHNGLSQFEVEIVIEQDGTEHICSLLPPQQNGDCDPVLSGPYNWSQLKDINVTLQLDPNSSEGALLAEGCSESSNSEDCEALRLTRSFVPRNIFNF